MKNTTRRRLLVVIGAALSVFIAGMAVADTYKYDALGRLTNVTYNDGSSITYAYDAAGNRTTLTQTAAP